MERWASVAWEREEGEGECVSQENGPSALKPPPLPLVSALPQVLQDHLHIPHWCSNTWRQSCGHLSPTREVGERGPGVVVVVRTSPQGPHHPNALTDSQARPRSVYVHTSTLLLLKCYPQGPTFSYDYTQVRIT